MIRIHSFRAENFLSFGSLDFTLTGPTLTYVGGTVCGDPSRSNGAGKSSMWEVVPYALYGKTVRGSVGDEVKQRGKSTSLVSCTFDLDSERYTVTRQRGKKNTLTLEKNGEDISGVDVSETQGRLENLLGMSFELFTNSVVFGQSLSYRFIQAPDSEKKAIFEQLLSLGWVRESLTKAKDLLQTVRMKWEDEGQEFSRLSLEKTNLEDEIGRWQDSAGKASHLEARLKIKTSEAENAAEDYEVAREKIAEIERNWSTFSLYEDRIKSLSLTRINQSLSSELAVLIGKSKERDRKIKEMTSLNQTVCPTCEQVVLESHASQVLFGYREQTMHDDGSVKSLNREMRAWVAIGELLRSIQETAEEDSRALNDKATQAREKSSESFALFSSLDAECKAVERELAQARKVGKMIEDLQSQFSSCEGKLESTQSLMESLAEEMRVLTFWTEAFGNRGLKSLLLDSVTGWMNQVATQLSSRISEDGFVPIFSSTSTLKTGAEREVFSIQVKHGGKLIDYKTISGGEKRRVDVIVLLTLCRLLGASSGRDVNLLVFDEVFESLDSKGIEDVVGVLQDFKLSGKSVFVVSHQEEAKSFFDEEITVTKNESGESKIN